jgi:multiple sugar transport system substrate-binding protein
MLESHSRRSFLAGALAAGALGAGANRLFVDGPDVRLRLLSGADPTGTRNLLVDMWNDLNPRAHVDLVHTLGGTSDQLSEFLRADADIYNLDMIHIRRFAEGEPGLRPVDLPKDQSFLQPILNACQAEKNKLWATPFNADAGMLFRRVAGPESVDVVPGLKAVMAASKGGLPQLVGQLDADGPGNEEAFVINVMEHALAQKDTLVDENGGWNFESYLWEDALRVLRHAIRGKAVVAAIGEAGTIEKFKSSKLRYMRNWPLGLRELDYRERRSAAATRIEIGPLPGGILGGQFLAISKRCPHPDQAEQVIRFLTGVPAQKILAVAGFAPTCGTVYNDRKTRIAVPHLWEMRVALEGARLRPMHKNYKEFSKRFAKDVRAFLYGDSQSTLGADFTRRMNEALS